MLRHLIIWFSVKLSFVCILMYKFTTKRTGLYSFIDTVVYSFPNKEYWQTSIKLWALDIRNKREPVYISQSDHIEIKEGIGARAENSNPLSPFLYTQTAI